MPPRARFLTKRGDMDDASSTRLLNTSSLHWADIIIIVSYFVVILVVGLWTSRRTSTSGGDVSSYFLASRNMHWIPVGASLFASNIGSVHFVGLAGSAAASGIGIATFELNAVFVLMILGWIFVPVYMAAGVYTMPEYLQKRFGGQRIRVYLSVLALILYVFTKISADLFAGALFIEQALGWNLYVSVILLLAVAALFTITGGLTAVIWTDFAQTILMVIGSIVLMVKSFVAVGGYSEMWQRFKDAEPANTTYDIVTNRSCGRVPDDSLHFFRDPITSDLPWTGVAFGLTVSAVWYWCSDQVIVQRALAAKSLSHAKAGTISAGYLKILPLFLLVFPGMIARILYPDEVGCKVPEECNKICGSTEGCTNIAYPLLVLRLMPVGLSGLMLAVMMAALLSSLTSIFNSSSTLFTMDIWTRIRKDNASDWELVVVGRIFVVILVILSILWIPIIKASQGSQLFVYVQSITSYLAPPICAVYVLAIFWERINEKGAFWSLMTGLVIGLIRFGLEFGYTIPSCGSSEIDKRPTFIIEAVGKIHYLHFGILLFLFCVLVAIVVSLSTERIASKHLYRLTFWSRCSREVRVDINDSSVLKQQSQDRTDGVTTISDGGDLKSIPTPISGSIMPLTTVEDDDGTNDKCWKKMLHFVCRTENRNDDATQADISRPPDLTKEEEAEMAAAFLDEKPVWKMTCNLNAIILMAITIALCAYYA